MEKEGYDDGVYYPITTNLKGKKNGERLQLDRRKIILPPEGIILKQMSELRDIENSCIWGDWKINANGKLKHLENLEDIYKYGNTLLNKGEKRFRKSINLEKIKK